MAKKLYKLKSFVQRLLFPPRCGICDEFSKEYHEICGECQNLPVIQKPICTKCGCGTEYCRCGGKSRVYTRNIAPFYYSGEIEQTIKKIKYSGDGFRCDTLGAHMAKWVMEHYATVKFDMVVAVPMHPTGIRKRGYNQAEKLARTVGEICDIPFCKNAVIQQKKNLQQHLQTAEHRKENVRGIYKIPNPKEVSGKTILLCDDILTTGSTAEECANMLIKSGAVKVYVVTAAIAVAKM